MKRLLRFQHTSIHGTKVVKNRMVGGKRILKSSEELANYSIKLSMQQ